MYGALLLFLYGVGVDMPLFLVGAATSSAIRGLGKFAFQNWGERVSGTALVALGLYLVWKA